MSSCLEGEYRRDDVSEIKVERYTFIVTTHFRAKDAPSVDDVARAFMKERANRTIAAGKAKALR